MRLYNKIKFKLRNYFFKPVAIPSYETKREIINSYRMKYAINQFVETGTFLGDTIEFFKNSFAKLISIELAADLADRARKRFEKDEHVTIISGDSGKILKEMVKNFSEPILFWLDGHYSSEFYLGEEFIKTARTDIDTPIKEELLAILSSEFGHFILIDDARLFNGLGDYPTIYQIKKIVRLSGKQRKVTVKDDMIRIIPI